MNDDGGIDILIDGKKFSLPYEASKDLLQFLVSSFNKNEKEEAVDE